MPIAIENEAVRAVVLPEYGGRVVSLTDRRSGRDWLVQGGVSGETGEGARYGVDEAVGWDECFPTVSSWDAGGTAWGRWLRDHGDLWGRPWSIDAQTPTRLAASRSGDGLRFSRTLSLEGPTLIAEYRVDNGGDRQLPWMWALHALLVAHPGESIELPGVTSVAAAYLSLDGRRLDFEQLPWPGNSTGLPFPLDQVQSSATHFAGKLYAPNLSRASVGGERGWLDLAWQGMDHLGIWLTYGGWPAAGNIHHVALEPASGPIDHLGQALDDGTAITLEPGGSKTWRVTMTLRPPAA